MTKRGIRIDRPAAGRHAAPRRNKRRKLPRQPHSLPIAGLRRPIVRVPIVRATSALASSGLAMIAANAAAALTLVFAPLTVRLYQKA